MKLWMRLAARLYPAKWRQRYAGEFEALLDDAALRWSDFWDVLRGALVMQMKMWTFGKVVAGFGLAGLAVAAVIAVRTPSVYQSTAVMRITAQPEPIPGTTNWAIEPISRLEQTVLSRTSLSKLIQDGDLYKEDRKVRPLEDIVQDMRNRNIRIQALGEPGQPAREFAVSFQYDNPLKAQWTTSALTARFVEANVQPGAGSKASLEVLDPPSLPEHALRPNRTAWVMTGLALGLVVGVLAFGIGKWPRVALAGLGAGLATLIAVYFIPDSFQSQAVLRVRDSETAQVIVRAVTDRDFLRSEIQGPRHLYPGKPVDAAIDRVRNHDVRVQALGAGGAGQAVLISFRCTDRYNAQAVMRDLVARAVAAAQRDPATPVVEVLDPASLPQQPFEPNRAAMTGFGLLGGLILGILWQIRRRYRTPAAQAA